ncbi:MAG TPA: DMT family transporter [Spirochaetota bacterium]|nr:DMT family transporter [Spirochaetota bacterium]
MNSGVLLLLIAEFLFAFSTVFVKYITNDTGISGIELSFFRFLTGFIITSTYIAGTRDNLHINKAFNVYMRGVFNTASVIFFFLGVEYSTISKTNLLNMTYPAFVFIFSPLITKEKIQKNLLIYLITVLFGIYLVVFPQNDGFSSISIGDIFGLLSGITAGFGISFLREARKSNRVNQILFYMFAIGTISSGILIINSFELPEGIYIAHVAIVALLSYLGQLLLTAGYKCVTAPTGSLISSSRIVFAMVLGVIFFSEPLSPRIIAGALMIMISLAGVSGFFNEILKKRDEF